MFLERRFQIYSASACENVWNTCYASERALLDCELKPTTDLMAKEKSDVPNLKAGENRRRSEVGNLWRDVLNIPQQPPWQFDPRASELDPPKPGLERRPLIYPPPLHHASYIVFDVEPVVNDPMHSEFRKRLEETTINYVFNIVNFVKPKRLIYWICSTS